MSDHFSPESAASILASSEPECQSSGNAKPTPNAGKSSQGIGRESSALTTCEPFAANQRDEVRMLGNLSGAIRAEPGMKQQTFLLMHGGVTPPEALAESMFSAEASRDPAKTSPSPATEQDSPGTDPASSSSSCESPMTLFGTEDGSSLRMFPDCFPATTDEISPSFSRRWPSSGFTTSPGECWTADTSECPNGGGEFSSLPDVLEAIVPERFYLSQRAAAGILRRAEKRGRELPAHLQAALENLADPTTTPHRPVTS